MYRSNDNVPMDDSGVNTERLPQAIEIIEQLSSQALKFRDMCRGEMERAQQTLEFWRAQHDRITSFLVEDQLSGPVSGPEDTDMPVASRMRKGMGSY